MLYCYLWGARTTGLSNTKQLHLDLPVCLCTYRFESLSSIHGLTAMANGLFAGNSESTPNVISDSLGAFVINTNIKMKDD